MWTVKTILLRKMSDFNNNSLSAGRGKALINAITFIKTIERSSPAKVNFPCIDRSSSKLSPAHWPLTTNMISTLRQSRNLSKNILFKILHALECIFIHIIKSRINILCYWKKPRKKNGRMTLEMSGTKLVVSRLLLESILCLMIPLHNILLYSPMHDAPLFSPNQKHHCYLKTVLYKIFENWCLENW